MNIVILDDTRDVSRVLDSSSLSMYINHVVILSPISAILEFQGTPSTVRLYRNYGDICRAVAKQPADIISFDYHLSHADNNRGINGETCALAIADIQCQHPFRFIVHSSDPLAKERITKALAATDHKPL